MASKTPSAVRGTLDVLPRDSYKWQYVERVLMETASLFGFNEIRVPVFENTDLFQRSVGDTTDVVNKEMYTFEDKGGRSITLRPEGTAGTVRSFLEHGLYNEALPVKACYILSCYRYEKPQAGRLREFHQFGVECFGAPSPVADAEVIAIPYLAFERLGISNIQLKLNSIGCPECRAKYLEALREFFASKKGELCETCNERLIKNPMRILDCKSPICSKIAEDAPKMLDFLCDECSEHFETLKGLLTAQNIPFVIDPTIVRGLDYYTRTVFEFVSTDIGSQGTVCGGGRYDGLVGQMGGPHTPSLGFAMGLERLIMVMESQGCEFEPNEPIGIYIAPMGQAASAKALKLCFDLRSEGFSAITDTVGRGLKAQMKYADKIGAKFVLVLGDDELEKGVASLKNMKNGAQTEFNLNDAVKSFYDAFIADAYEEMENSVEKGI
ncbi:MAG: histidine--tRNA ligase [Clostridia bacterium]|nr:histidine--tRNA ligase [Clostridia bacterium]